VALTLQRDGDYRINVDLNGTTTVLVRSGATHLTNRSGEGISLRDGQGVVFAADGTLDVADAHSADSFDHWCSQRDTQWQQRQRQQQTQTPVQQDLPGTDQLNDSGQWNTQSEYGAVWFPAQVGAGWAPFQNGRWAWVVPWGWTWIDKAPWGFAPFHYGRWVKFNGRWGWVPPPAQAHRSFAPALIAAPASVTSTPPLIAHATHVNAPPAQILHRPVVTTRDPVSAAATAMPHVVVNAPASRPLNSYQPIPSPIGPTIYARDVRPVEHSAPADNTTPRDSAVHAPWVTSPARASSLTPTPPSAPRTTVSRATPIPGTAPMPATPPAPPAQPLHRIAPAPQPHTTPPRPSQSSAPARAAARPSS
ncbi:MAG TPA: DUF6600 domain-containing protein, partial [Steroidobacteraceae bacterium]|nr:DUF6600 domain-containing protein [Steroidobacteraceae bacterium]